MLATALPEAQGDRNKVRVIRFVRDLLRAEGKAPRRPVGASAAGVVGERGAKVRPGPPSICALAGLQGACVRGCDRSGSCPRPLLACADARTAERRHAHKRTDPLVRQRVASVNPALRATATRPSRPALALVAGPGGHGAYCWPCSSSSWCRCGRAEARREAMAERPVPGRAPGAPLMRTTCAARTWSPRRVRGGGSEPARGTVRGHGAPAQAVSCGSGPPRSPDASIAVCTSRSQWPAPGAAVPVPPNSRYCGCCRRSTATAITGQQRTAQRRQRRERQPIGVHRRSHCMNRAPSAAATAQPHGATNAAIHSGAADGLSWTCGCWFQRRARRAKRSLPLVCGRRQGQVAWLHAGVPAQQQQHLQRLALGGVNWRRRRHVVLHRRRATVLGIFRIEP